IAYAGGNAVFRGVADLASAQLGLSLAGSAEALPVTALAADLGYAGDIEGTLSVLGGLTAQGDSVDALVRSLSGRLAAAVAEGHIEGAAYDLLATDLLGWLLSGGLLRDATDFHCAAVNFNILEGRAISDRLYVLTRNMVASGDAAINLPDQRLDIRIQPRARQRSVQMPSSITVRGPLDNPKVGISPIAATMDTSAKILFFVPDLILRLFGLGPDAASQVQPCTVEG
ncbi:MAG: AsmA-like C-terminal region-containing protein, partial [Chromatocurvus sp.]